MHKFARLTIACCIVISACSPIIGENASTRPAEFFENRGQEQEGQAEESKATNEVVAIEEDQESKAISAFEPAVVELVDDSVEGDEGLYIYLFTHTEDHINHELSEERYLRMAPEVAELAAANPESGLVWTIEFQGADAQTVAARNEVTGIVDMLSEYGEQGWIEFGYHAHHDPTYFNRPQKELSEGSSWAEQVAALDEWISCRKHPYEGGCLAPTGGGITAVEAAFGSVDVVSGLGFETGDVGITGGAGTHAIHHYEEDMLVSFGFSDHSPASREADYDELVNGLMDILSPVTATAKGIFWMDDLIRINDASVMEGVGQLNMDSGPATVRQTIEQMDREHVRVMNAGIMSKFTYAATGNSPTVWAYANPDSPELSGDQLNSVGEIERNYQQSIASLNYLVEEIMRDDQARFIGNGDLVDLVAPDHYWEVSDHELDAIARWLLQEWGEAPPAFASDGLEYYSLRDAIGLLAMAIYDADGRGNLPDKQELILFYGPLEAEAPGKNVVLDAGDVIALADEIAEILLTGDGNWQMRPGNILPGSFDSDQDHINSSQALYALAYFYAHHFADQNVDQIEIPATAPVPVTYDILDTLGCWDCYDTAWSLKPAKVHE